MRKHIAGSNPADPTIIKYMVARLGTLRIGFSVEKNKWFIYNSPSFPDFKREFDNTTYYDTFDDASLHLGIMQEKYKGQR